MDLRADVGRGDVARRVGRIPEVRHRGNAFDHRAVAVLRILGSLLGLLLLGDVVHHALHALGASRRVHGDRPGFVADPDDAAVLGDEAVLLVERRAVAVCPCGRFDHLGAIVGVDVLVPERGRGHPLFGGVAEEALHLRADVGGADLVRGRRGVPRVGDRRHLLDERAEASLGLLAERTLRARLAGGPGRRRPRTTPPGSRGPRGRCRRRRARDARTASRAGRRHRRPRRWRRRRAPRPRSRSGLGSRPRASDVAPTHP